MESQFFTFEGWDQDDAMVYTFHGCTLTKDFAKFKKGDVVSDITMDYGAGKMTIYMNKSPEVSVAFNLSFTIKLAK